MERQVCLHFVVAREDLEPIDVVTIVHSDGRCCSLRDVHRLLGHSTNCGVHRSSSSEGGRLRSACRFLVCHAADRLTFLKLINDQ